MTHDRIIECKNMINILKNNAKSIPSSKQSTIIKSVKYDSFIFVMNEILNILEELEKVDGVNHTLYRNEKCDRAGKCFDYIIYHCEGCNGAKEVTNDEC